MSEIDSVNISWDCSPIPHTYHSLRKLRALKYFKKKHWKETAYNLCEALSPTARLSSLYRNQKDVYSQDSMKNKLLANYSILENTFSNLTMTDDQSDDLFQYVQKSTEDIIKNNIADLKKYSKLEDNKHLESKLLKFQNDVEGISRFQKQIKDLPKEWTIIQLTADYDPSEQWEIQKNIKTNVKSFYLTLLKSQAMLENADPITIKISPYEVKVGEVPLFKELHDTLQTNLNVIENNTRYVTNVSLKQYWEKRGDCDLRLLGVLRTMDCDWLQGWRCILNGDILNEEINLYIKNKIKTSLQNSGIYTEIIEAILFKMASMIYNISSQEILNLIWKMYTIYSFKIDDCDKGKICPVCKEIQLPIGFCVQCEPEKIEQNDDFIKFKNCVIKLTMDFKESDKLKVLPNSKRGPVVLLIDEKIDIFPWESLQCFKDQLVTRMESLHFTHALFKSLEDQFVDGYFQLKPKVGSYLLNPGGDLKKMEMRMGSFIDYWCPDWKGQRSSQPADDIFQKYLQESDVFLYCGHNDGSQFVGGGPERLGGIKAVTTLSGCGSVRLRSPGTRLLPLPVHSHYHHAKCPCVIGMLWEVTDLEVDKVTSMFLGLFLPSKASKHWGDVNKSQWSNGIIDTTGCKSNKFKCEPNMLKALALARKSSSYAMIASSVVSRGLPVSIHPDYKT